MNEKISNVKVAGTKNLSKKGIALLGLCVVACKLPFLIAFLGFGGIGATASLIDPSSPARTVAIGIALLGLVFVSAYFIYTIYRKANS